MRRWSLLECMREGLRLEAYVLWLLFLRAVVDTAGIQRLVLDYGRLMAVPAEGLARLVACLQVNISGSAPPTDVQWQAVTELVLRLRRQTAERLSAEFGETCDLQAYEALLASGLHGWLTEGQ
jgi:hypothetical protein